MKNPNYATVHSMVLLLMLLSLVMRVLNANFGDLRSRWIILCECT